MLNEVHIDEVITYTIIVTVPEGIQTHVTITDLLDTGLTFTDVVSITASSADITKILVPFLMF